MFDLMPFEHVNHNLDRYFNNLEKTFFRDFGGPVAGIRTDILDEGDHFLLQAELPGFSKEDIQIDLNGDTLTISAEHNSSSEQKDEKNNFIRRERHYGSFARSFDVSNIDTDKIGASYENGVLELKLPKKGETQPQSRRIALP